MKGNAAVWLEAQPNASFANMAALKAAFEARYKPPPDMVMYRNAKQTFSRRQEQLPAEDYVAIMQKLAKKIDRMTRFAILNGLRAELQPYVIQKQPETMDDLISAVRMAELTCISSKESDSTALSMQLANMQDEIKKVTAKWDILLSNTAAAVGADTFPQAPKNQAEDSPHWRPAFSGQRPGFSMGPTIRYTAPVSSYHNVKLYRLL